MTTTSRQGSTPHPVVVVADDDVSVRRVAVDCLQLEGFAVLTARDGTEALRLVADRRPDALVLDIGLPDVSGLDVLRQVRATVALPVILLTGRDSERDRVEGLDLGADDYVTKPFSAPELAARLRAVLRRTQLAGPWLRTDHDGLVIDGQARTVTLHGEPVDLTAKEFDVLACLARAPGQVFSRQQLLAEVWGAREWQDPATVTEHVHRIRRKIEVDAAHPRRLVTVRGAGYRYDVPPSG